MDDEYPRIYPLGQSALTVEFGNAISPEINDRAIALANAITTAAIPGVTEAVPAYASTSIFFDTTEVHRRSQANDTAFDTIREQVEKIVDELGWADRAAPTDVIEVRVDFSVSAGPDLEHVARTNSLSIDNVIEIFTEREYRVYMIGFLPGFAYMGEVDERIATPRRDTPRIAVPRGSVGIAGRQTGIYPFASPGGWQLIGRTSMTLFDPDRDEPCIFKPGDRVKFVPEFR